MLEIFIPSNEYWDEKKEEFIYIKEQIIYLEHSLISISKWESKWKKPFLSKQEKTNEETIDYISCMIQNKTNVDICKILSNINIDTIRKYINDDMTATIIKAPKSPNKEIITSELIYYWMIMYNIPFECQRWHLNRLLTLIEICSIKNSPNKKMNKKDILSQNAALNASRRNTLNTKG